jgi:hypothetical protein
VTRDREPKGAQIVPSLNAGGHHFARGTPCLSSFMHRSGSWSGEYAYPLVALNRSDAYALKHLRGKEVAHEDSSISPRTD